MEDYSIVYDIADKGMKFHWLISLPFILVGVGVIVYQVKVEKTFFAYRSIFGLDFASFALFWVILVGKGQISNY